MPFFSPSYLYFPKVDFHHDFQLHRPRTGKVLCLSLRNIRISLALQLRYTYLIFKFTLYLFRVLILDRISFPIGRRYCGVNKILVEVKYTIKARHINLLTFIYAVGVTLVNRNQSKDK